MNIFVTYSNDLYAKTRDFSAKMAKRFGRFDKVIVYNPNDIDEEFKRKHHHIFENPIGAGLWLWKPYVVLKVLMEEAKDGDVVFYADAGSFFIRHCSHIIDSMHQQDIWVSDIPLAECEFTKPVAFDIMKVDREIWGYTPQIQGNFIAARKTDKGVDFVRQWLEWCTNYELMSPDSANVTEGEFVAHRMDQSVLSLLTKKTGLTPHLDPTQYGIFPSKYGQGIRKIECKHTKEYPASIVLHRRRDLSLGIVLRQTILTMFPWVGKLYYSRYEE